MIVYDEPVPGVDKDGKDVTCNHQVHVTEEDAIKIQRRALKYLLKKRGSIYTVASVPDQHLLDEFIIVHWASKQ